MLYTLLYDVFGLNIFKYITMRTGCATLTALMVGFILGPWMIRWLKSLQGEGQPIREAGPESHKLTKKGTPTMGGALILSALAISILLWGDLTNLYLWITLLTTLSFGLIGVLDDYRKVTRRNTAGISGRAKLALQVLIAGMASLLITHLMPDELASSLALPFFKNLLINGGWVYVLFEIFVIVGASNAVNLTDGLDGLAIGPVIICALCFALITYLVGHGKFAHYLQLHFVPGSGELAVLCGALVGASLGFLWFNAPPAMVFMGDTGSLAIGASLGIMSVITKHEVVFAIIGGLFVVEALSVMIQVSYFKWTGGRRIFLMAPIHHHFEQKGWSEPTIVIRFWIIAIILALVGLATLKLR